MSLAHDLTYRNNVEGSAARPLPKQEPEARPARKSAARRSYRKQLVVGAAVWIAVMGLVLLLVHRNTQALAETAALTQIKDEIAALEASNAELEGRLDRANSVGAVTDWATAHGMVLPAKVTTVKGNPAAVAARPQAPAAPAAAAAGAGESLWASVKAYLSRIGKAANLAGGTR